MSQSCQNMACTSHQVPEANNKKMTLMNIQYFKDSDAEKLLTIFRHEFGEIKPSKYGLYADIVFNERNSPKRQFDCTLTEFRQIYIYAQEENELGIFQKTFVLRCYKNVDPREIEDPEHFRVPHIFISVTIYNGFKTDAKWCMIDQPEFLYINYPSWGAFHAMLKKELARDFTAPKFAVWYHYDPAIMGDYFGESYDELQYIGFKDQCIAYYESTRLCMRTACGPSCGSYGYPRLLKEGESLGTKHIIHPARSYDPEIAQEIEAYESEE